MLQSFQAEKLHAEKLGVRKVSLWSSIKKLGRNVMHIMSVLNRNLTFALMLLFTYVVALASVALLLGVLLWGVYTFVPAFFWEHLQGLGQYTALIDGVPMLYQGIVAVLTFCLCFYVGRPYCAAVLAIQNCLINKDYARIKTLLLRVNAHMNGLIHNVSGFILKCAVATAVVYCIWQALKLM